VFGVQLSKVRKALGDDRKQAQFIETVHGEGYRFIANVTERQEELYPDEPKRFRHWWFAVPILLVLVGAAALLWNFAERRSQIGHEFTLSTVSAEARSRYELAQKYESEGDDEQALATLNEATTTPATMNGMISLFRLSFVRLPCGLRRCGMVDLRLPPCHAVTLRHEQKGTNGSCRDT
jgi:hypothetical protein